MATGSLSLAIEKCRSVLAATVAVQEWLGIDTTDADAVDQALLRIHAHSLPRPEHGDGYTPDEDEIKLPFALIGPPENDAARVGMRAYDTPRLVGVFELQLFQAAPRHLADVDADAAWFDTIGQIMEGFAAQAVADGFPLQGPDAVRLAYGPWRPTEIEDQTRLLEMAAMILIEWGSR
jgi:hypothetical protein